MGRSAALSSLGSAFVLLAGVDLMAQLPALGMSVSLGQVIVGLLLMLSTYLFTASIRQGKEITELKRGSASRESVVTLEAQQIHNADNIAILQGEAATIDRRIADSRHDVRNEIGSMLGEMELRLDGRLKEVREAQANLLAIALERRSQHRKEDPP